MTGDISLGYFWQKWNLILRDTMTKPEKKIFAGISGTFRKIVTFQY